MIFNRAGRFATEGENQVNHPIKTPVVAPDGWGVDELSKFDAYGLQSRFKMFSDLPEWHKVRNDI